MSFVVSFAVGQQREIAEDTQPGCIPWDEKELEMIETGNSGHHRGMESVETSHRRRRNLTDEDIECLVNALNVSHNSTCRFGPIDPSDLSEAVTFYKNANKIIDESKSTIWKTLLVIIIGGFAGVIWLGFLAKVQK